MTEEFLYYIWQHKLFVGEIMTSDGQVVQIIQAGYRNHDAGPDFLEARVRIGSTIWAGHVEMHVRSSDWKRHHHHRDHAYDNVVLHVVFQHDMDVFNARGIVLPAVEVKERYNPKMYDRYQDFYQSRNGVACEKLLSSVEVIVVNSWIDRMAVERLEEKYQIIMQHLKRNGNDWEQTFFEHLAGNFGFKKNKEALELAAQNLPVNLLQRNRNNSITVEALLFGVAGLLQGEYRDDYPRNLQKEYRYQEKTHMLHTGLPHLLKFLRMRPNNFPTIRLAQLADLMQKQDRLLDEILRCENIKQVMSLFDVKASSWWDNHYSFSSPSPPRVKVLGLNGARLLIINTVVPFLFAMGRRDGNRSLEQRAIDYLLELPGENNVIVRKWKALGMDVQSAYNTQALIQLYNHYCVSRRCLHCSIGNNIFSHS